MISWLITNSGSILVFLILVVLVLSIIRYLIKAKKKGLNFCGQKCDHCACGCSSCGSGCGGHNENSHTGCSKASA